MAAAETVFLDRLSSSSAVTSLVGGRIYGSRSPENAARPFLVLRRISGFDEMAHDGRTVVRGGRMQIDSYADSHAAAVALARAARLAIVGANDGDCYAWTEGETDIFDDQATPRLFRRTVDLITREID